MKKSELRAALKLRRNSMTKDEVLKKSAEICQRLTETDFFEMAQTVMVYLALGNEADTEDIIKSALLKGKRVLVPVTEGDDIIPCILTKELKKGKFGISEPAERKEWTGGIDLCIIPGLGFDRAGGRIGFGKGYYDRFLLKMPCKKIGIAFSNQIEEDIFAEPHDIPMDIIVTEEELFYCG